MTEKIWYLQECVRDKPAKPFWDSYVHPECRVIATTNQDPFKERE